MKSRILANWLLNHPDLEVISGFIMEESKPKIETASEDIYSPESGNILVKKDAEFVLIK